MLNLYNLVYNSLPSLSSQTAVSEARGAFIKKLDRVLRERSRLHGDSKVDGGQVQERD